MGEEVRRSARPVTEPARSLIRPLRRSYVHERFLGLLEHRLVFVRAPAGYGKTLLMAGAWRSLRRRGLCALWIGPRAGTTFADMSAALCQQVGVEDEQALAERFRAATAAQPVYVFVDEVERFGTDGGSLEWLVEFLSEGVRLAFAGRRFPPMRLSRLRMHGLLAELGHPDLAFGRGETQQLLGQALSPEALDRLSETLAGWPALVQLAAVALERTDGLGEQRMLIEGTHPILRDFVLEEVVPGLGATELAALAASVDLCGISRSRSPPISPGCPRTRRRCVSARSCPRSSLPIGSGEAGFGRIGWFPRQSPPRSPRGVRRGPSGTAVPRRYWPSGPVPARRLHGAARHFEGGATRGCARLSIATPLPGGDVGKVRPDPRGAAGDRRARR